LLFFLVLSEFAVNNRKFFNFTDPQDFGNFVLENFHSDAFWHSDLFVIILIAFVGVEDVENGVLDPGGLALLACLSLEFGNDFVRFFNYNLVAWP